MSDRFDEKKSKPFCSIGCLNAEMLFNLHFSDEEINRRAHYRLLTKGDDTDDEEDESLQKQRIQHPPPQSKK